MELVMDPIAVLKRCKPGDHLTVINSNGDKDDVVVDRLDFDRAQIIPTEGNAIAFGDVGHVVNLSEDERRGQPSEDLSRAG
jgi:hypothetical protein